MITKEDMALIRDWVVIILLCAALIIVGAALIGVAVRVFEVIA